MPTAAVTIPASESSPIETAPLPLPIGPEHFLNRELSWLEFNGRVLEEAEDETNPLLERLKFLSIFSGNLDEFMMVRLSGIRAQLRGDAEPEDQLPDTLSTQEQFNQAHSRTHELVERQYKCLNDLILPRLAEKGLRLLDPSELSSEQQSFMNDFFHQTVYPVLTPMAIDPSHPTPHLRSRGLYVAALIEQKALRPGGPKKLLAVVQIPSVLPRLIRLPSNPEMYQYILLDQFVGARLSQLFGGSEVTCWTTMRITRDSDLDIDGDQVLTDLSQAVEEGLRQLRHREVVRLEIAANTDEKLLEHLRRPMQLQPEEIYQVPGLLDLTSLMEWHGLESFSQLRDDPFVARRPIGFEEGADFFRTIRKRDVLIHHPYETFHCVIEFLQQAAEDPDVLAIKQTLYRTGKESPIVRALIKAAENGKNVTAVVELLARFDELSNVTWARQLERAGVHVVYGFVTLKTHCKVTLVVRREGDKLRRYVHLGTGNYNASTAKIYTDFGLFTSRRRFGEDATALFNFLTGYARGHAWHRLAISPQDLHRRVLELIRRETDHAKNGTGGRIIAKLNALVDPEAITALYRASQAGVKIDLQIRGSCTLRPGVPGISDNIRVTSVLDRFLEHSRLYLFGTGDECELFLSSADWMPRNFHRRVEVMFPVLEPSIKKRFLTQIIPLQFEDNVKTREMLPDGKYRRVQRPDGVPPRRAQVSFLLEPPFVDSTDHEALNR